MRAGGGVPCYRRGSLSEPTMRTAFLAALLLAAGCADSIQRRAHLVPGDHHRGSRFAEDVVMRDGVKLHTYVRLPDGEGPWPVVLTRTAYPFAIVAEPRCTLFNRRGYACVWQSTRGRQGSEGTWEPFFTEPADGMDTLAWIDDQPWQDGNVALFGESYMAATQWALAPTLPPQVKTIIPISFGTNTYDLVYRGGLFRHEIVTAWMSIMPDEGFNLFSGSRYKRALKHRPRVEMDEVASGAPVPWFRRWLGGDDPAHPMWHLGLAGQLRQVPRMTTVPVMMLGGWSDVFFGPQADAWANLATKAESVFVIGPWGHEGLVVSDLSVEGLRGDPLGLDGGQRQWTRVFDWLGHHLKGEPLEHGAGKVTRWVQGAGWLEDADWPPATEPHVLALAPGDDARACLGALQVAPEALEISWTHDPHDPVPTKGGAGLLASTLPNFSSSKRGARNQGGMCERRDDVLGFHTEPLVAPLHVAGALQATLEVSSDVAQTAFAITVLEERPNGQRIHVRDGITTLTLGAGIDAYTPGEVVEVSVETWPIEWVFEPGSRVLLQVASSSFPKYESHPNVTGPWAEVTETKIATQTLHGGTATLPVRLPR